MPTNPVNQKQLDQHRTTIGEQRKKVSKLTMTLQIQHSLARTDAEKARLLDQFIDDLRRLRST